MDLYILHTTPENFKYYINPKNGIDSNILLTGTYETHIKDIIDKYVKKDMVCLDIGANMGVHAVRMGMLSKKVICVEPMPINDILKKKFRN